MTVTRRAWLAAAAALAGGCRQGGPLQGGWVGAAEVRGHAVRDGHWTGSDEGTVQRCSVAVVGAGVAGLAAARALTSRGVDDVCVFELDDAAGGNSRGHVMGGLACPLGAHYLPVPGPAAGEVSDWLHEIGVASRQLGRTHYDERYLCHAPQERVFLSDREDPRWLAGLMPWPRTPGGLQAQARRFAAEVRRHQLAGLFTMPTLRAPWTAELAALDTQTFADWLAAQGYTEASLLWHLDYCCRDDYGAGSAQVSAWAGLHYFASRHGFRAPSSEGGGTEEEDESDGVLTWPEGNAWLTHRLAAGLGERLHLATAVTRISPDKHGVTLSTWQAGTEQRQRWRAQQVVLCLPLHVAVRLVDPPPPALTAAAARLVHAPWLVSNLQLKAPLLERLGPPMAWDNVLVGTANPALPPTLGYVDATHQSLASRPPLTTVLTHYWALGGQHPGQAQPWRRALLQEPWSAWAQHVLTDLVRAHPDLPQQLERIDLMRYGHAMSVPVPGVRRDVATGALAALARRQDRLHFAHADLSGYSVFEEAFTRGTLAGQQAADRGR